MHQMNSSSSPRRGRPVLRLIASVTVVAFLSTVAGVSPSPQFNPFNGQYEMTLPGAAPQFNAFTGNYEMGQPGSSAQFNGVTGQYEHMH